MNKTKVADRFIWSKCDRCGKSTVAAHNGIGELFVLDQELGKPLSDQGSFCRLCSTKYDRDNWVAWFKKHRPEIFR